MFFFNLFEIKISEIINNGNDIDVIPGVVSGLIEAENGGIYIWRKKRT